MDSSRHDAHIPVDYTYNIHHKDTNGDEAPFPNHRNDSTGSFPEDFPGDSPYGSVGGSLVRRLLLRLPGLDQCRFRVSLKDFILVDVDEP